MDNLNKSVIILRCKCNTSELLINLLLCANFESQQKWSVKLLCLVLLVFCLYCLFLGTFVEDISSAEDLKFMGSQGAYLDWLILIAFKPR